MNTFDKFLHEQKAGYVSRAIPVSIVDARQHVLTNCSRIKQLADDKGIFLWRGQSNANDYAYFMDPRQSYRRPLDNPDNVHNKVIKQIPSWQNVPNREYSIMCTPSESNAKSYGTPYRIFPEDSATYVVCTSEDFLTSFPVIHQYIGSIGSVGIDWMLSMLNNIAVKETDPVITDNNFKEWCDIIDKTIKDRSGEFLENAVTTGSIKSRFADKLYNKNIPLYNLMCQLLDFKANGFRLTKDLSNLDKQEVWFDVPCVVINRGYAIF